MKAFSLLLLLLFSLTTFGQKKDINSSQLIGCWTDSREENKFNKGINVYRPCNYKQFPASRFRFKMNLQKGNSCSYLFLAPTDGHFMKKGTWSFDKQTNALKIFDDKKKVIKQYIIYEVNKNVLKIK